MGTTKQPAAPKKRATITTRARRTTTIAKAGSAPFSREEIETRARQIYVESGYTPGHDEQNWLEAERQLSAERKA